MKTSLRVLLERLIDYAGLYPPASLPFDQAVAKYDSYRRGDDAWMLGRFVVPASRAADVPSDFPIAAVGVADDVRADSIEIRAAHAGEIAALAGRHAGSTVYVEVADVGLTSEIAKAGLRAKIRTGGVTPEAFPSPSHIAAFIRSCAIAGVAFKATAGLHHPIRCRRALTYDPDAPIGLMHGFINVFMAAALLHDAEHVLVESDPSAFRFDEDRAAWRDREVPVEHLRQVRRDFAISFGSCSFEEPLADLRALGWM